MMICKICKKEKILAKFLGICKDCILERWEEAKSFIEIAHQKSRREFSLPEKVPKSKSKIRCNLCANECQMRENEFGFCGLRKNEKGKLISFVSKDKAILEYYYDPIPTNCVAAPWCNAEERKYNLALFLGACLPSFEKIFVSINGKPKISTIGEIVEEELKISERKVVLGDTVWAEPKNEIRVISFNPKNYKVELAPVSKVMKRIWEGKIIEIKLEYGRRIHVTPEHPLIVLTKEGIKLKPAFELEKGDSLPILKNFRVSTYQKRRILDLIDLLKNYSHRITVYGVRKLLFCESKGRLARRLRVKEHLIDNWRKSNSMPLKYYLKIEKNPEERKKLKIKAKYCKGHLVPAQIKIDENFAAFLGFYLAEGCLTKERRLQIDFSFKEDDLARAVQKLIKRIFKIQTNLSIKFWKGKPSVKQIVGPKTLYYVLSALNVERNSYTKEIPPFVFQMPNNFVRKLLDAYFLGDGHARYSANSKGVLKSILVISNSSSPWLNYGLMLLLARFGIIPRLTQKSIQDICIEGRKNVELFFKNIPSLIKRAGLKFKRKLSGRSSITETYPAFLFQTTILPWKCQRISPKLVRGTPEIVKNLLRGDIHFLKVKSINFINYKGAVYDLEVNSPKKPYGNFLHGDGVFSHNCNFNCLFCQNWHFKFLTKNLSPMVSIEELLKAINEKVHCVCFFGGDPGPQLPFVIEFSKRARKIKKDLRICLETNGIENKKLLEEFAKISFESNGIIKFDLKFFDEKLSIAISGVSNKRAFENFENLAKIDSKKLVASTLLIPGYVDETEVFKIANFISSIDPEIPYNLLAFYPCFKFTDLPTTSFEQAQSCFEAAKKAGLKNVRIGNVHLLS